MSLKTVSAGLTLALLILGSQSLACPMHDTETQAMSCTEGHSWDEESGTCLPVVAS